MLKSADIKAIAKQVALEMYSLNDEVLSLSDVAIKLSKSEAAIKQMCYRGQLPFHKQHKTYYFSKNEITNFLLKKVNVWEFPNTKDHSRPAVKLAASGISLFPHFPIEQCLIPYQ